MAWNLAYSLAVFVADGFRTVGRAEYERRITICDGCEERFRGRDRCRHCGCKLSIKARGRAWTCPIGKWDPANINGATQDSIRLGPRPSLGTDHRRITIVSHGLNTGGAERWALTLAKHLDTRRLTLAGLFIAGNAESGMRDEAEKIGTVWDSHKQLPEAIAAADIVVVWGVAPKEWWKNGGRRVVVTSHGSHPPWSRPKLLDGMVGTTDCVAVSEPANMWAEGTPVTVIHNGIDTERCTPIVPRENIRHSWGLLDGEIAIGFMGRIAAIKQPVLLAHAVAAFGPPYRAVFCGPAVTPRVVAEILSICPNAIILPAVDRPGDVLAGLDCFVLPSKSEAMSLALMEAWWCRVPTVATPVGAVPELEREFGQLTVRCMVDGSDLADAIRQAIAPENNATVDRAHAYIAIEGHAEAMGRRWSDYLMRLPLE